MDFINIAIPILIAAILAASAGVITWGMLPDEWQEFIQSAGLLVVFVVAVPFLAVALFVRMMTENKVTDDHDGEEIA